MWREGSENLIKICRDHANIVSFHDFLDSRERELVILEIINMFDLLSLV